MDSIQWRDSGRGERWTGANDPRAKSPAAMPGRAFRARPPPRPAQKRNDRKADRQGFPLEIFQGGQPQAQRQQQHHHHHQQQQQQQQHHHHWWSTSTSTSPSPSTTRAQGCLPPPSRSPAARPGVTSAGEEGEGGTGSAAAAAAARERRPRPLFSPPAAAPSPPFPPFPPGPAA